MKNSSVQASFANNSSTDFLKFAFPCLCVGGTKQLGCRVMQKLGNTRFIVLCATLSLSPFCLYQKQCMRCSVEKKIGSGCII